MLGSIAVWKDRVIKGRSTSAQSFLDHVKTFTQVALKQAGEGLLEGVICGRAIYDRQVDPAAAIALLDNKGQ